MFSRLSNLFKPTVLGVSTLLALTACNGSVVQKSKVSVDTTSRRVRPDNARSNMRDAVAAFRGEISGMFRLQASDGLNVRQEMWDSSDSVAYVISSDAWEFAPDSNKLSHSGRSLVSKVRPFLKYFDEVRVMSYTVGQWMPKRSVSPKDAYTVNAYSGSVHTSLLRSNEFRLALMSGGKSLIGESGKVVDTEFFSGNVNLIGGKESFGFIEVVLVKRNVSSNSSSSRYVGSGSLVYDGHKMRSRRGRADRASCCSEGERTCRRSHRKRGVGCSRSTDTSASFVTYSKASDSRS